MSLDAISKGIEVARSPQSQRASVNFAKGAEFTREVLGHVSNFFLMIISGVIVCMSN